MESPAGVNFPKTIDINHAKINAATAAAAAAAAATAVVATAVVLPSACYCLRYVQSWGRADRLRRSLAFTVRRRGPMAMAATAAGLLLCDHGAIPVRGQAQFTVYLGVV